MKGLFQIILGLLFLVIMLLALTSESWLWATIKLIQGGIVIGVALIGVVLVLLGITALKED